MLVVYLSSLINITTEVDEDPPFNFAIALGWNGQRDLSRSLLSICTIYLPCSVSSDQGRGEDQSYARPRITIIFIFIIFPLELTSFSKKIYQTVTKNRSPTLTTAPDPILHVTPCRPRSRGP